MAVSDPATDVPTPTGTLQGIAAYSWDGSVWQPSGRAGPGVATPTGVLRGVAPFSWNGAAWQPIGQAGPSVATPTGALDGVAVYAWSGSAWTPLGGGPMPSTPSGALRGVAAFSWDGAAWQPVGQAGPSVATPTGALDGVAMFNWTGSSWAAGGTPSLDLSFMAPGVLDPRITFARASIGTYFDAAGTMQTAPANMARWDYDPVTHALKGVLVEEIRTNLFLNSATLGTQSATTTATPYTLSFYGTGTVTLTGVSTAGPLVGAGAFPQRVALTFTPTAGSLTCTVTGSVLNAQLEAGNFATSYIPTTAATVTRGADYMTMPTGAWFNTSVGSVAASFILRDWPVPSGNRNNGVFVFDNGAGDRQNAIDVNAFGNASSFVQAAFTVRAANATTGAVTFTNTNLTGVVYSVIASSWGGAAVAEALNGQAVQTSALTSVPSGINRLSIGYGYAGLVNLGGWFRGLKYWPRVLSGAELQAASVPA